MDDFALRDTLSIASTDSFVSTAEVRLLKVASWKIHWSVWTVKLRILFSC